VAARVVHDDDVRVTALFEASAHGGRSRRATTTTTSAPSRLPLIVRGTTSTTRSATETGRSHAVGRHGVVIQDGELFRSAVALALTGGDDHGRDRHDYGRTEASFSSAASVSTFNAKGQL